MSAHEIHREDEPNKRPAPSEKPNLDAILPDAPRSPADVFADLDDYQKRIEVDWESTKAGYKDKVDNILEEFLNKAPLSSAKDELNAIDEKYSKTKSPYPSMDDELHVDRRMERLLRRVERTLRSSDDIPHMTSWGLDSPSVINIPSLSRRLRTSLVAVLFLLAAGFGTYQYLFSISAATPLPYLHPCSLVFSGEDVHVVDWFRRVLYHHHFKHGFPIQLVEYLPNNFISGYALSDKFIWTVDGFNHQILQHSLTGDHRVLKQFATPGNKPMGLFWDGTDLWSADSDDKKIYRHFGSDPESIRSEYGFMNITVNALYFDKNRLWVLDGKSRMLHYYRLEDPLREISAYDLDGLLKGASPTDFTWHGGKFWILTEGPAQILKFSRRELERASLPSARP